MRKTKWEFSSEKVGLFLIIIEFLLFRTFVVREICNVIPLDIDQSVYLNLSYSLYNALVRSDYREALTLILNTANTGLPILGTVMLFLFGQSRLSVLLPNFIGFIVLQITGYKAVNKIFVGRQYAGWGYVGTLLLTNTTFMWIGGIVSFRADFLFACLFSVWCILLFEAVRTENEKTYFISSLIAGCMLFVRFFAICFLVLIMLVEIITYWRTCKDIRKTLIRLLKYTGGVLAGGGWFFLINIGNFLGYYLSAMTGDMKEAWQIQLSLWENLLYYPKYFISTHMGYALWIFLLVAAVSCLILSRFHKQETDKQTNRACLILAMAFIIPYLFLLISNKQPVVISMWDGIFIFAVFFIMGGALRKYKKQIVSYTVIFLSYGLLAAGCLSWLADTTGKFYERNTNYLEAGEIWRLNNTVVNWASDNQKDVVHIVLDRWNDVVSLESLEMCSVESGGELLHFDYAINCLNANFLTQKFEKEELDAGLHNADIVITARENYNYESSFPTDQLLDFYHKDIQNYAADNLELLGSFDWRGNELQVYARRPIFIDTEWPDWLGIRNTFHFVKEEGDQLLVIEGTYMDGVYPELIAEAKDTDSEETLKTNIEISEGTYKISINISELTDQEHEIELIFDSFFVPSEASESLDNRQLTVLYPSNCIIERNRCDD